MPISEAEAALHAAWRLAQRTCECQRPGHGHQHRCPESLTWGSRGKVGPGGWQAKVWTSLDAGGADVPENYEILCWRCFAAMVAAIPRWEGPERRRAVHARRPTRIPVTVVAKLEEDAVATPGEAENVSAGGALLALPTALQPGVDVALTFAWRSTTAIARAATVRWLVRHTEPDRWAVGVAFQEELPASVVAAIARARLGK